MCTPPKLPVLASILCMLPSCVRVWPGPPCSSAKTSWRFCMTSYLLHGGGDSWILTSLLGPPFPPGPYPMGLFQADIWSSQSLLSWRSGLWAWFLPFFLPSASWTPPSFCHCSQSHLQLSHPKKSSLFWWVWGPVEPLSWLASVSLGTGIHIAHWTSLALLPHIINTSFQYRWLLERK